jgi:hypothetical protein
MNCRFWATGSCLVLVVMALSSAPADAATRKRVVTDAYAQSAPRGATVRGPNVSYMAGPRTRIFITKRSWLDAGTEVKPGERHYLDYAIPPDNVGGIHTIHGTAAPAGYQNPNWPLLGKFEAPSTYRNGW